MQKTLKDLETAYSRFLKGLAKFPGFKKRSDRQYFRFPQHFCFTSEGNLQLTKMSPLKRIIHPEIKGEIENVTISENSSGKYYASIVADLRLPKAPLNG